MSDPAAAERPVPTRVLLVDDDEDDYILTRNLLAQAGDGKYALEWASSYEEGSRAIQGNSYDAYLFDYHIGKESGLHLLNETLSRGTHQPIILLTGSTDRSVDLQAMKAGAAEFLVKGRIDADLLDRTIRYAVEHTRTLEALRESEERYALAVRGANDGLWDWNLKTGRVFYSARWKTMLDHADTEVGDSAEEWFSRIHPEDVQRVKAAIQAHLEGLSDHFEDEYRLRRKDGVYRWMLSRGVATRDDGGTPVRFAGSQADVTERRIHDALTNLPDRTLFMDRLNTALERAKRHPEFACAVLFLDLDRFKLVNDTLGHLVGDQLLVATARRLKSCVRSQDTVARFGGDEFAVLIDGLEDNQHAVRVAQRILEETSKPFYPNEHEVFTSASIGIALSSTGYESGEAVLRDADTAMYRAKEQGKARYEIFDSAMRIHVAEHLQLETEIRHAIQRGEFKVYFQPIVRLDDHQIVGFESLLRWQHPERGLLGPTLFVPYAEETGIINILGPWATAESCGMMARWRNEYAHAAPFVLHVNVSGKQFMQGDFIASIERILTESGFPPSQLVVEITESALMEDTEAVLKTVTRLKELGLGLCIDDFGKGYSSLSYLHRFPFDVLKIDQSFVGPIEGDSKDLELVKGILALSENFGLAVVAEGIETREQAERLRSLNCAYGQGYFFCQAVGAESIESIILSSGLTHFGGAGSLVGGAEASNRGGGDGAGGIDCRSGAR